VKVKMLFQISGTRNGADWPAPGETVDLPEAEAAELVARGQAEPAKAKASHDDAKPEKTPPAEKAVVAPPETAVLPAKAPKA